MNQMTPITRKRKAKKDSLQEQFEKNVELVGVYDSAEDMVKDLEQQAKKPKRKTRFETEPEVANMVEQTRAAAEITKNARKTLQEEFTQMVEELDSSKKEDTLMTMTMTYKCLQQLRVWWRPTMGRMTYPVLWLWNHPPVKTMRV